MSWYSRFVTAAALALAAFIVACDSSPTRPSQLPLPVPNVFTNRIEITGPTSIAPGQTVQLTATAYRSDSTTADITSTGVWRSSRPPVLSVSPTGSVTAHAVGEAVITVTSGTTAAREIVVVPAGTYRVVGMIVEADSPTLPVPAVQVEVVGGSSGLSTITSADGRYRLYGVPADAEIRVTKAGYAPVVERLSLSDHQTRNFALALLAPRVNVAGTYTLTLLAAAECRDRLPQDVWSRRYTATITQNGALIDVLLQGATFVVERGKGNRFSGRVEPGRVSFTIQYGDFYYYKIWPDIIEEINPSLYFGVYGSVNAAVTPGNISGALNGEFSTVTSDPRRSFPAPNQRCHSAVHQLVLQQ